MTAAAATRLDLPIAQHTLANGLRVVANPDPLIGVVAVQVRYDVGSRHEVAGRTGFAHLFEHLMFCGSAGAAAGEHFSQLQRLGAAVNGTTSFDRTNYYETVPAEALPLALWLEADRMATLLEAVTQESLDTQREVVKEEKRQSYDNQPYGDWGFRGFPLLFGREHPYGHLPIGSMADLDAATLDDVHAFFRRHYGPDNAVLAVAGGVDADAVFALAEEYFGSIPAIGRPPRPADPAVARLDAPRAEEAVVDVPSAALFRLWRAPAEPGPDLDAVRVAIELLAAGSSSRLENALTRRTNLAASVHAGVSGLPGVSVAQLVLYAHPRAEVGPAVAAADAEIRRLLTDGADAVEVATAKAQIESGHLRRLSTCAGRADELAKLALHPGDPTTINSRLDELAAITVDQVDGSARAWLAPEFAADLSYRPSSSHEEPAHPELAADQPVG